MVRSDTEALEILRKVYEHQPAGALAASVVIRIADYHWAKSEWPEAEDYYDKYCREYPNGQAAREAEFKRAKCAIERCRGARYDTTCLQLAYDRLRQFQAKFPDVAEREGVPAVLEEVRNRQAQALYEIAARYHRAGQVLAAAFYAERLRERFPDSPWNAIAMKFMAENAVREEPGK
jgi:outer membrane assembly lipoprotein YfiO